LEELLKTNKVKVPVAGTLIEDIAIVCFTTCVGGLVHGSFGATVGIWPFDFFFFFFIITLIVSSYCHRLQEAH
jgi:hypothetical protein